MTYLTEDSRTFSKQISLQDLISQIVRHAWIATLLFFKIRFGLTQVKTLIFLIVF